MGKKLELVTSIKFLSIKIYKITAWVLPQRTWKKEAVINVVKLFCYKTRIRCRKIDCGGFHLIFSQTKLNLYLSFKYLKTQENLSENQPEILIFKETVGVILKAPSL